jgi:hypothetical protein
MSNLKNARYLKALFIDYIIEKIKDNDVIGSEIMFGSLKGIADLVLLSEGLTFAYEVKAQNDDFRKIKLQLKEYNKTFDFVYVITTEKHLTKAINSITKNNGIILIYNDSSIRVFRESKQNYKLDKEELLSTMTIRFIEKKIQAPPRKISAYELRKSLEIIDQNILKSRMYEFLYNRIRPRFDNFLAERGIKTHFEEIALLSFSNKKIKP